MFDFMIELKKSLDKIEGDYVEIFYEDKYVTIFEKNELEERVSKEKISGLQLRIERGKRNIVKKKETKDKGKILTFLRNFEKKDNDESISSREEIEEVKFDDSFSNKIEVLKNIFEVKKCEEFFIKNEKSSIMIISSEGKFEKDERELTAINLKKSIKEKDLKVKSSSVIPNYADEVILKEEVKNCLLDIDRLSEFFSGETYKISGELKAVLSPKATSFLLNETIGHLLEADLNFKTKIVSSLNEKICNEKITIMEKGPKNGYMRVDDEGEPPKKLFLIEEGRLVNLLTNRKTSLEYKLERSGNARRYNFRCNPIVGVHTLSLLEGDLEEEEMIADISFGVYIKKISDGFISLTKRLFSFPVLEGYIIREGKLCEPLFGVQIKGEFFEFLNSIKLIGKKKESCQAFRKKGRQFYLTSEEAPAVYLDKIKIY